MLRKVDRVLLRVASLPSAVAYFRDVLGLKLVRHEGKVASFRLAEGGAELVLHDDPDLPGEATYYLVDDVRDLYRRRAALKLTFMGPPTPAARGHRATVKDPFGNVLLLLDRTSEGGGAVRLAIGAGYLVVPSAMTGAQLAPNTDDSPDARLFVRGCCCA